MKKRLKQKKRARSGQWLRKLLLCCGVYVAGMLILTGLVLQGIASENWAFPVSALLCAVAGAISAIHSAKGSPQDCLLPAALFAAILSVAGVGWCGVNWAGEGGGLLGALAMGCGVMLLLERKKRRLKRKMT